MGRRRSVPGGRVAHDGFRTGADDIVAQAGAGHSGRAAARPADRIQLSCPPRRAACTACRGRRRHHGLGALAVAAATGDAAGAGRRGRLCAVPRGASRWHATRPVWHPGAARGGGGGPGPGDRRARSAGSVRAAGPDSHRHRRRRRCRGAGPVVGATSPRARQPWTGRRPGHRVGRPFVRLHRLAALVLLAARVGGALGGQAGASERSPRASAHGVLHLVRGGRPHVARGGPGLDRWPLIHPSGPSQLTRSLEVKIATASVSTGDAKRTDGVRSRDEHLRSADFFNTAEFPEMVYKSTRMNFNGDTLESIDGTLTLLGVTKPVKLAVTTFKCGPHPFNKKPMCGAYVEGVIKRTDFGMKYGVPGVSDDVKLAISVEAYPE
ncbi:YceI family protein [Ramlibacter sp. PS3R-8]|uniref:YceI family protein n=1 Tax=Ramlibacter sp. PS3R-8 TaxID=3133437 RepID=UPI0030AF12B0